MCTARKVPHKLLQIAVKTVSDIALGQSLYPQSLHNKDLGGPCCLDVMHHSLDNNVTCKMAEHKDTHTARACHLCYHPYCSYSFPIRKQVLEKVKAK